MVTRTNKHILTAGKNDSTSHIDVDGGVGDDLHMSTISVFLRNFCLNAEVAQQFLTWWDLMELSLCTGLRSFRRGFCMF